MHCFAPKILISIYLHKMMFGSVMRDVIDYNDSD
jgi:hypothetical protein